MDHSFCSVCGGDVGAVTRVLSDRHLASNCWNKVVPISCRDDFFRVPIQGWSLSNLSNRKQVDHAGRDWDILFEVVCWQLWSQRNNFIFRNVGIISSPTFQRSHFV